MPSESHYDSPPDSDEAAQGDAGSSCHGSVGKHRFLRVQEGQLSSAPVERESLRVNGNKWKKQYSFICYETLILKKSVKFENRTTYKKSLLNDF